MCYRRLKDESKMRVGEIRQCRQGRLPGGGVICKLNLRVEEVPAVLKADGTADAKASPEARTGHPLEELKGEMGVGDEAGPWTSW